MSCADDYAKRIIAIADEEKDFVTAEDGYVVYWPKMRGFITSTELRIIADELDRRNAQWDAELKNALSRPASEPTTSPPG